MRLALFHLALGFACLACDLGGSTLESSMTAGTGAAASAGAATTNGGAPSGGTGTSISAGMAGANGGTSAGAGTAGAGTSGSATAGNATGGSNAGGFGGLPSGGASSGGASATDITLMTFNVRTKDADGADAQLGNDWAKRLPLARAVLADHTPAIVGLQEATTGQVSDLKGTYTALPATDVTVLYDPAQVEALEGAVVDVGNYGNMDPWGTRYCNWQRFKVRSSGAEVVFFNTHLSTAGDNVPQSKFVFDLAQSWAEKGYPAVVVGDFNYDATQNMTTAGWADAVSDHAGTFHAFGGGRSGPRLDFIGIQHATSIASGVDTRTMSGVYPSDHYPVWAQLQLQ